ncbi:MAG: ferrous iron transport protein B [Candidatus Moranbacteria bacterium]|nr:ferrous iron transport protein B [Candidatus Moranbacteria bacterium]
MFKIALVGNTNAGKTTFLNIVCGLNQESGNYPGTTVDVFKAKVKYKNIQFEITDLPGTYSLTPFSEEEKVTREILKEEKFDLVVQIIEPNFKKRSLALTLELMELGLPLFIVFNNKNNSYARADYFLNKVKEVFKLPGLSINAVCPKTKQRFFNKILNYKGQNNYGEILNFVHPGLSEEIVFLKKKLKIKNLWIILKVLENDQQIIDKYAKDLNIHKIFTQFKDKDYSLEIKKNRFDFIERKLKGFLKLGQKKAGSFNSRRACPGNGRQKAYFVSDKIDRILLDKRLGIGIFLILMWSIFQATFALGSVPMKWIDQTIACLQEFIEEILPSNLWTSLLTEGVIGGVGATFLFLPTIMLLFFLLSILQQSGYLARVAYLLDSLMQKIGLGGKCFVPLLMGFGCSVTAIMATRTLKSRKEKIITSLMIPFMSCGAKLPVYTFFISAFFEKKYQGTVLFIIYVSGILAGIFSGWLFNKFIKEKNSCLLLELPAYTVPRLKNVWQFVYKGAGDFLKKVGKVVLPVSVILWFLFSFPSLENKDIKSNLQNSYAAGIGKTIEPIFFAQGFDWRVSTGLMAGLGAKEVFISTFGALYSIEEQDNQGLINKLKKDPSFDRVSAVSLLIFILIYTPCIAALSVLGQEIGWKWALMGLFYPTVLAWILSALVYRLGLVLY